MDLRDKSTLKRSKREHLILQSLFHSVWEYKEKESKLAASSSDRDFVGRVLWIKT